MSKRKIDPNACKYTMELTPTEQKVHDLLIMGKNKKTIASELIVSHTTVATHMGVIYAKKQVHSQPELISKHFNERIDSDFYKKLEQENERLKQHNNELETKTKRLIELSKELVVNYDN